MSGKYLNKYRGGSLRLKNWDYRWNANYFITICTEKRECYFGNINAGNMILSELGKISYQCWLDIPLHFPFVELDAFIIMPDHVHGIIKIKNDFKLIDAAGSLHATIPQSSINATIPQSSINATIPQSSISDIENPRNEKMANISPKSGSLSAIIRSYKSAVTRFARQHHADFAWQSKFHDQIIWNSGSLKNVREYIKNNPKNWMEKK